MKVQFSGKKGPPFLVDPQEIKDKPNGFSMWFSGERALKNANSFRMMVYRAGRQPRVLQTRNPKTGVLRVRVSVFDKEDKK